MAVGFFEKASISKMPQNTRESNDYFQKSKKTLCFSIHFGPLRPLQSGAGLPGPGLHNCKVQKHDVFSTILNKIY